MWIEILLFVAIIFLLLYRFNTKNYGRWEKEGIPTIPGRFPYGSHLEMMTQSKHLNDLIEEDYSKFKSSPVSGVYFLGKPILSINDMELIRHVMVKDFNYFVDRQDATAAKLFTGGKIDEFWRMQLTTLEGDEWKDVRSTFSPIFTSGKMKGMVRFILEVGKSLTKEISSKADSKQDFELKVKN